MKRYYSHYTFIYPDIFLKNTIVELDEEDRIIRYFTFEREIANTEFSSGLQVFIPFELKGKILIETILEKEPSFRDLIENGDYLIRGFSV